MAHLTLRLLGAPEVYLDGRPLTAFATDKARALLYYLASESDRPHRREALAGLLWPDQPEERARQSLRQTLTYLRQTLGESEASAAPLLAVTREAVQLDAAAGLELDSAAFVERIQECRRHHHRRALACPPCLERLRQAAELYRGDLLSGFLLGDSVAFEEWATLKREWLHREAVAALALLADFHERRGEYDAARGYAQRLVALEPWREEAHRQLMGLWALAGQRSAALAQYEACARALSEELGIAPTPETVALRERIRAGTPLAASAPAGNLPPPATTFVGRQAELAELAEMLADPACRLITLVGMGGAGKTRLALQAAAAARGSFADGVFLVALAGVSAAEGVAPAVADALGLALYGREAPADQLLAYLRQREVLLVLDTVEHLLPAADLLARMLQRAPGVVLLVTSRERVNLQEEWLYEVGGLPPEGAAALYVDRARRVQRHLAPAAEAPHIARICALLEGMPLALELAAAGAAQRSCAETAAAIASSLDVLRTTISNVPQRHRSMAATFDYSWALLTAQEQDTFRRLAVFRGGFDGAAAAQVAEASPTLLGALIDKSLLQRTPAGRYHVHDLLRQYAAARLAESANLAAAVRERHGAYYAGRLEEWEGALLGQASLETLSQMRTELENLRAAWHWAVAQGRLEEVRRAMGALTRFYLRHGPFEEGTALLELAVAALRAPAASTAPPAAARLLLAQLLCEQARLWVAQAQYERAHAAAQEAIALVHGLPPAAGAAAASPQVVEGLAHLLWGQGLVQQGAEADARPHLAWALALTLPGQPAPLEGDCRRVLGTAAAMRGDYRQARDEFIRSLAAYRALGDAQGEGQALNNLGLACWEQGDLVAARQHLEDSLQIKDRLGDRHGAAHTKVNLGIVCSNRGEYAEARDRLEEALEHFRQLGNRRGEAMSLSNLGVVLRSCGLYGRARACLDETGHIYRQLGDWRGEGLVRSNLGLLEHLVGDETAAAEESSRALEIARDRGDRRLQGYALTHRAHALLALGRIEEAAAAYAEAVALRRELGLVHLAVESQAGLARARLAQGRTGPALAAAEEILHYLDSGPVDGTEEPLRIYWTCCQVLRAAQDARGEAACRQSRRVLSERAERIHDPALRHSFLEEVALHRQVRDEAAVERSSGEATGR